MLNHDIIEREGVALTMFLCILDLAACRLAGDHVATVARFWPEILTEICVWCLTTILSLHAFAWSGIIILKQPFFVKAID